MKMTDQLERDYFQAELASGRVGQGNGFEVDGVTAASVILGMLLIAAALLIWLGQ